MSKTQEVQKRNGSGNEGEGRAAQGNVDAASFSAESKGKGPKREDLTEEEENTIILKEIKQAEGCLAGAEKRAGGGPCGNEPQP